MATHAVDVEHTTTLALQEKGKLIKSLRRFDMVFFTICAFVGLDTLGTVAKNGPEGLRLARCLGARLRRAVHAPDVRGRRRVHSGGRAVRVDEAGLWPPARGHRGNPVLGHEPTLGRRLARVHRDRRLDGQRLLDRHARAGAYFFCFVFIWISIGVAIISLRYGKQIPNAGAVLRAVVLGFFSLTMIIYGAKHGFSSFPPKLQPDEGSLLRARSRAAVQLRRLRAAERRRRGDGEPAEGRADLDPPQRHHRGAHVRGADLLHPARPPGEGGHGHRRVHRRRHARLPRRVRRRRAPVAHRHDARLRRGTHHVGRRLDDRLRPDSGGRFVRRCVLPVLRRLQQEARDAGPRQRDVRHRFDDLLLRRHRGVQGRDRLEVLRRPHDRHLARRFSRISGSSRPR